MKQGFRERLAETHGTRFELLRHFLPRFFDSDLISSSGDFTRVAGGAIAMLASVWMILAYTLFFKYQKLFERNAMDQFAAQVQSDLSSLAGITMCLTLLLVAALWQSLFPSLRDYLALAAFPVSSADLFIGKFSAVCVAFGVFVIVALVPAVLVFSGITGAGLAVSLGTLAGAATMAFFVPIAAQGVLLNVLPARLFERAMISMQALLAATALGGFPVALTRGPALTGQAWKWIALLAPAAALFAYVVSFHRYRRLVLEAPQRSAPRRLDLLVHLLDRMIKDPREQAALEFIWRTLQRSKVHRLAVLVYLALGAAWLAKPAFDALTNAGIHGFDKVLVTTGPAALIVFGLAGLRYLFSLPVELRANWMFQIMEREGRVAWLNAVEKFVLGVGVAPVVLLGAIFVMRTDGLLTALAWTATASMMAAIGFEALFRRWRKLPFTCTFLPGKRPLIASFVVFLPAIPVVAALGWIVYLCSTNPASLLILLALELGIWSYLRQSRLATWGVSPLQYEEQPEAAIDTFGFSAEGTVLAQEQFQREWKEHLRGEPDPILRPLEEGETRSGRVREWLTALPQDLHYAMRLLLRKPGFAFTVVVTLSLGLGLNAAFFTIFNSFLLRPVAVRDPASLVSVEVKTRYNSGVHLNWQEEVLAAGNLNAFKETAANTLAGTGIDGRSALVGLVSGNFFTMLGAGVVHGRPFEPGERTAVVVLSHRTWQRYYDGDANILGRSVMVNGAPFQVIGIAAPEFAGVAAGTDEIGPKEMVRFGFGTTDLWIPFEAWNAIPGLPRYPVRGIIGRLAPDRSEARAEAMLAAFVRRLTANRPEYDRAFRVELDSLDIPVTWTALRYSLPLLIAFGLTMLIPCANAANLMLARSMARQREFGARLSLGASRGRLVRQLLTESVVLAVVAGAAGLLVANAALHFFVQWLYRTAPPSILFRIRIPDFVIDGHVFFYMLVMAALTTVLFAMAPAAQTTRVAVSFALRGEFGVFRASRLRDTLVVAQVSACVMLLATASVMLRGTDRSSRIERGYDARGVFAVANQGPESARALASILEREPWLELQGAIGSPLNEMRTLQVGNPARPGLETVYFLNASGEILPMVRVPILRGRTFTRDESENRAPVAVISEAAARKLWPGEDPLGKSLTIEPSPTPNLRTPRFRQARVVGVSKDFIAKVKDGGPRPTIHFPDTLRNGTIVVVRGKGRPEQTAAQLEAALLRAPGSLLGARVVALQETLDWETYPQSAVAWLSTILGSVALLLTVTGVYAVMSYMVSQRTKEIGIRMALGATPLRIARFILAYSIRLGAAGLLFGTVLAVGVMQYSSSKIPMAIDFLDLPAYAIGLGVVALAALCAAAGPARRACGVDPQDAVRTD
jgi:predicted permease